MESNLNAANCKRETLDVKLKRIVLNYNVSRFTSDIFLYSIDYLIISSREKKI